MAFYVSASTTTFRKKIVVDLIENYSKIFQNSMTKFDEKKKTMAKFFSFRRAKKNIKNRGEKLNRKNGIFQIR